MAKINLYGVETITRTVFQAEAKVICINGNDDVKTITVTVNNVPKDCKPEAIVMRLDNVLPEGFEPIKAKDIKITEKLLVFDVVNNKVSYEDARTVYPSQIKEKEGK